MAGINIAGKVKSAAATGNTNVIISTTGGGGGSFTLEAADRVRLILMIIGIASVYFSKNVVEDMVSKRQEVLKSQSASKDEEITKRGRRIKELQSIKTEADQFDNVMAEVQKKLNLAESVGRDRNFLVRAVDFLVQQMPPKVWMKSISIDVTQEKKISIEGSSIQMQTVSDFLFKLQPGSFFSNWELEETQTLSAQTGNAGDGQHGPSEFKNFKIKALVSEP